VFDQDHIEEANQIELRSEEVREILGTPPSWIVRWGTTVVCVTLLLLVLMGWIINYPDIIKAPIVILTQNPPTVVIARADGNISKLFVKEKEQVNQGQLLGLIQNTANYEDIQKLSEEIDVIQNYGENDFVTYQPNKDWNLGDLQADYSIFMQSLEALTYSIRGNYSNVNISQLSDQITNLRNAKGLIEQSMRKANEKLATLNSDYKSAQKLYSTGTISQMDLKDVRNRILNQETEIDGMKQQLNNKDLEINTVKSRITEIRQNTSSGNSDRIVKLKESINNLKANLEKWKQAYLFTAPITGQVSFFSKIFSENQFIKAGEEILAVVPNGGQQKNDHKIIGKILMPMSGTGKVKEGQRVVITLDSYPFQEFGSISGKITSKSLIPKENNLILQVELPDTLVTSYGKTIKFEQLLQGQADIITENRRFLERVFDNFLKIFKKY
jgi:multidrug resistance efflux pump